MAERLEDHKVVIEVLVENGLLDDQILTAIENSSTQALVESSAVTVEEIEGSDLVAVTFPGGPDGLRFTIGEEFTDTRVSYPDDVDGEALTQEINEASGQVSTEAVTCCDDNGYCNLCEDVASSRCTFPQPPYGTCGSYQCGMTVCDDPSGGSDGVYGWSCDCCGGGHWWCSSPPECYDSFHC